ncbi:MAG: FtsW/RodA/SpoVE family cell cycle protein, partial [Lachnospiraceae bacterium]|nr:FtsW/RodA/SpoVE family cell cycle protein [Lachnospiraceae bacterium]
IIILFAIYVLTGFSVVVSKEEKLKVKYKRQRVIIFIIHFLAFLILCLHKFDKNYVIIYLLMLIYLIVSDIAYRAVYKGISVVLLNTTNMLLMLGLTMLTRLNTAYAYRQLLFIAVISAFGLFVPYLIERFKYFEKLSPVYAILGIALLGIVLLFGKEEYGARNWLSIHGILVQPSEFVKILFVFFLASALRKVVNLKQLFFVSVGAAAHVLILVMEKDLGGALIFFLTYLFLVFVVTRNYLYLLIGSVMGCSAAVVAYQMFGHVRVRVQAYLDPWSCIENEGYQVAQSLFAIGTGNWLGMGFTEGMPESIPVVSSDFIFSAFAEEFGVFFAICIIMLEITMFIIFVNIAIRMKKKFYKFCALGLSIEYITQVLLTIGGAVKFLPSTGVTLPLISYGGSSVISTILLITIIQGMYALNNDVMKSVREKIEDDYYEEPITLVDKGYDGYEDEYYAGYENFNYLKKKLADRNKIAAEKKTRKLLEKERKIEEKETRKQEARSGKSKGRKSNPERHGGSDYDSARKKSARDTKRAKKEKLEEAIREKELEEKRAKRKAKLNKKLDSVNNKNSDGYEDNDNHELTTEEKRKKQVLLNKKYNKSILKVTYVYVILFFLMTASIVKFMITESDKRINSPYNRRQDLLEEKIIRGDIISSDGEVLATTKVNESGKLERVYPYGATFCHAIGRNSVTRTGIELSDGFSLLSSHINPIQKFINDFEGRKSAGDNLVTTINSALQETAVNALGNYKGAVVAIEPKTGKVLAMVSKPDYNPNTVVENWDTLKNQSSEDSALLNRATSGLYTPGSTFKILTALEYVKENIENREYNKYSYTCNGTAEFSGYAMRCYDSEVHGKINLEQTIAHSCNNSIANIGLKLNLKNFKVLCNKFGFNKTIEGNIETADSKFTLSADANVDDIIQTSIGQGETLVSPLLNCMIVSTIGNNGKMMEPQVVDHMENANGKVISKYKSVSLGQKCSKKEAKQIKKYLKAVVDYGTASALSSLSYDCAGKTGSAEVDQDGTTNAWFVGYAPENDPKIAVAVIVEGAGTGSTYAVPVAKAMFEKYLGL